MARPAGFRRQRWSRVASEALLDDLEAEYAELSPAKQAEQDAWVDEVSDYDLEASIEARRGQGASGTIDQIMADVGDDPAKAAAALSAEQAAKRPRSSLIEKLQAIAEPQS